MSTLTSVSPSSNRFGRITNNLALIFGRTLAGLLSLLLCLPVILLPLTTSVPVWVWIILAIADIAFIILQFRFALVSVDTLKILVGIILVSLIAIAASQFFASTPAIRETNVSRSLAPLPRLKKSLLMAPNNGSRSVGRM